MRRGEGGGEGGGGAGGGGGGGGGLGGRKFERSLSTRVILALFKFNSLILDSSIWRLFFTCGFTGVLIVGGKWVS